MKVTLRLLTVLLTAALLSSCSLVYSAWGEAYRWKGGYYKTYKTKPVTPAR